MHFKWIFVISSCLILSASSARRGGGGGGGGSRVLSRGATSFSRPATISGFSGSPRFSSSSSFSGRGPRTNTLHIPRGASAPPLSSFPRSQFPNSLHVPRPASAPPLSSLPPLPPRPPFLNRLTGGPYIPPPPPPLHRTPFLSNPRASGPRIPPPPSPQPRTPFLSNRYTEGPRTLKPPRPLSTTPFLSNPPRGGSRIPPPPPLPPTPVFSNPPRTGSRIPKPPPLPPLPPKSFNRPPAKNSGSGIPPAPLLPSLSPKSNLPKNPPRGGSRIPPPPPLPPTPVFSNTPRTGSRIPNPPPLPPLPPLPPTSFNRPPAKNRGSGIPPAPPLPSLSPKSNLPKNVPKRRPGKNSSAKNSPPSQAVITPVVVSPIMTIPSKRNSTTNGKSSNPNKNLGKAGNSTAQNNLSKLPPLKPLLAGTNSTGGGFKNDINLAKGSAVNSTIKGSPKNTTKNFGLIGNNSGRNFTGTAKLNGTAKGFPQVLPGINSQRNFTLSSSGMKANHTTHNNTRNATGIGFHGGVGPISQTQTSPIAKFPWETLKTGNPQQAPGNNMSPWGKSVQNYDVNNGDAPRKPRSDVVGDLTKKIVKSVASQQKNGAKSANYGLNSGLDGHSWNANRNEYVWKSSVNTTPRASPSKIMKNQIILITILISVVLIAAGVIVYFCNRQ